MVNPNKFRIFVEYKLKICHMTIIGKAKELLQTHGKEYAIKFFQDRIEQIGTPKNFDDVCAISGNETAIEWLVLGPEGMELKAQEIVKSLKK